MELYDKILKKNYILVHETNNKTYLLNCFGSIIINGLDGFNICRWLTLLLDTGITITDLQEKSPDNLRDFLINLVYSLIKNKLIYFENTDTKVFKSHFEKKLLEYLNCYHIDPDTELKKFFSIKPICYGYGELYHSIKKELSIWQSIRYQFPSRNQRPCSTNDLSEITDNYCVIESDVNSYYLIDINNKILFFDMNSYDSSISKIINNLNLPSLKHQTGIKIPIPPQSICQMFIAGFFYQFTGLKQSLLKTFCKDTLQVQSHRMPLFFDKIIPTLLNEHDYLDTNFHVRKDIPILGGNESLISEMESINQTISYFIDEMTGPIVHLSESDDNQLPLSVSECSVIKNSHKLKCYGLSARECRNQVVLYALENYINNNYEASTNNHMKYTAGWSKYECIFRSVRERVKICFPHTDKIKSKIIDIYQLKFNSKSTIWYLLSKLKKYYHSHSKPVTFYKISSAYYICEIKLDNGPIIREIGLSIKQSLINTLNQALIQHIFNDQTQTVDLYLALSWADTTLSRMKNFCQFINENYRIYEADFSDVFPQQNVDNFHLISLS